jgi:hypothetical protein
VPPLMTTTKTSINAEIYFQADPKPTIPQSYNLRLNKS